jgi:hypothetical protein
VTEQLHHVGFTGVPTAPVRLHGSTALTDEQQAWYMDRFGVRYRHVAQNQGAGRKQRRWRRKRDLG